MRGTHHYSKYTRQYWCTYWAMCCPPGGVRSGVAVMFCGTVPLHHRDTWGLSFHMNDSCLDDCCCSGVCDQLLTTSLSIFISVSLHFDGTFPRVADFESPYFARACICDVLHHTVLVTAIQLDQVLDNFQQQSTTPIIWTIVDNS